MFAVVATGGKQYSVQAGDIIKVEKLDANVGDKVKLDVLMISDDKGVITGSKVKNAVCEAEVVSHGKADKIVVYKYKAKKNQRKKQGHRQPYTEIKILSVKG